MNPITSAQDIIFPLDAPVVFRRLMENGYGGLDASVSAGCGTGQGYNSEELNKGDISEDADILRVVGLTASCHFETPSFG